MFFAISPSVKYIALFTSLFVTVVVDDVLTILYCVTFFMSIGEVGFTYTVVLGDGA